MRLLLANLEKIVSFKKLMKSLVDTDCASLIQNISHLLERLKDKDEYVYVEVGDNGTGMINTDSVKESESIGSSLIESFLIDLEAKYEIENNNGVLYKFTFSKNFSID